MFGLRIVDLVTLVVYLLGITVLGVWMGRTVKNTADYFVGGRRFGKLMGIFSVFGAGTHSDQAVSVVAKTYSSGMSGIWYQWLYLFVTPFNWWITPILRRCRAITTGDYFEARYSRGVATLYVLVGIGNMMVAIGVMLKGSGAVIKATTGGQVSEGWAIAAMTLMFVIYGVVGGLAAAVVTDFVQGLLTIVFSFMLLPFAIIHIGGFTGLHEKVARTFADHPVEGMESAGDMWSLVAPGEIGLFYIAMIVINALVGIVTQPHVMPISGAVKTERETQIGSVYGSMIKRVCTVAWTLLGMYAIARYPGLTDESQIDQRFGQIAHDLLPQIAPGLIGIFIAALLASIMSSCDAFMITCSGLFTQNIYRPFIAPRESQRHYIGVGRIAAVLTVAGGVVIAYALDNVIQGLELLWKVPAIMGIAFWAGLFWRRATVTAAWVSTLLTFLVVLFTSDVTVGKRTLWSFTECIANARQTEIPTERQEQLDSGHLTLELHEELERRGVRLPVAAAVKDEDHERITTKWLIRDGDRVLTVHRESEAGPLLVYADSLCFTVDAKLVDPLDDRALTKGLRQAFAANGVNLTDGSDISVKETEKRTVRWLISDEQQCCTILRGNDDLEVYLNRLPLWMLWKGELGLPWQMLFYLSVGLIVMVGVSLVTVAPPRETLDGFYETLRTPVQPGEVVDQPLRLPVGMAPGPQRKLINLANWEIQRPTTRGIGGFIIAWMLVAALIGLVWGLVRIGA